MMAQALNKIRYLRLDKVQSWMLKSTVKDSKTTH